MSIKIPQKILIADDDPLILSILNKLLRANNYEPYAVSNGKDALSLVCEKEISLIITDLNMPTLNGEELCKAVREKNLGRYIYIIMVTAQTGSQALISAMNAGADDYILKPINALELNARLKAGLRVLQLETTLDTRNKKLSQSLNQIKLSQDEAKSTILNLLPKPAVINGIRFDWLFEASNFIGGDIFNYFPVGENHVGFYIVDVAGHGVAAAMQAFTIHHDMITSIGEFESMIQDGRPNVARLTSFIFDYNNRFVDRKENDSYFTMFFGLMNARTGEVSLMQAGHPPAIHIGSADKDVTCVGEGDLPIGMVRDVSHAVINLTLDIGDRLCFYSDGITECENSNENLFGQDQLTEIFIQDIMKTQEQQLLSIRQNLREWNDGEQFDDDVTCLMIEYQRT